MTPALVLGFGNPGRQDDGLGFQLVEQLTRLELDGVATKWNYQLNIEHAAEITPYHTVVFADASLDGTAPYALTRVSADCRFPYTSHGIGPEAVMAICTEYFGPAPDGWLLAVRGYEFGLGEELSPGARDNLRAALAHLETWLRAKRSER